MNSNEPNNINKIRYALHKVRVNILRVEMRIAVIDASFCKQILHQLNIREKLNLPNSENFDETSTMSYAEHDARMLEANDSRDIIMKITVLCIGPVDSGKTSTINHLLSCKINPD